MEMVKFHHFILTKYIKKYKIKCKFMERDWGKMTEEVTPSSFDNILCPQLKDTYMIIDLQIKLNNYYCNSSISFIDKPVAKEML